VTASCSTAGPSLVSPLSSAASSSPAQFLSDDDEVAWLAGGRSEEHGRKVGGRREEGGGRRRRRRQLCQTMREGVQILRWKASSFAPLLPSLSLAYM
jgi:hypothetical protein